MKVTLIRPNSHTIHKHGGGIREYRKLPPKMLTFVEVELGLMYIASYLERAGHQVKILDLQLSRRPQHDYLAHLDEYQPGIVGITAYTGFIDLAHEMAVVAKQKGAVTVAGGHHPAALPTETLRRFPSFDFVIHGEGELPLTELADALQNGADYRSILNLAYRCDDNVVVNPAREPFADLDAMPYPARHLVDLTGCRPMMNDYVTLPHTNILASRGCPYYCIFCCRTGSRHLMKYYIRSAEALLEEIEYCRLNYGIRDFRFVDDTFTFDRERIEKFCDGLDRLPRKINWSCYVRPDEIDEPLLRRMKKSGCFHVKYGFEVGTKRMMEYIRKEFTVEQCVEAARITRKVGIEFFSGFIFGFPGETVEEMEETLRFAIKVSPDVAAFQSLVPFPGSNLFLQYDRQDQLLSRDYESYLNSSHWVIPDQVIHGEELAAFVRKAFREFYFRPSFILQKIRRIFVGHPLREIRNLMLGMIELIFAQRRN